MPQLHARTGGEVEFSDGFAAGISGVDLAQFSHGNPIEPGVHSVDVWVNGEAHGRRDITFVPSHVPHVARPCLSRALFDDIGLGDAAGQAIDSDPQPACIDLPARVDGASVRYDDSRLRLLLSLPQAALPRQARGFVAPSLRDHGVTAAFVDYNANSYRSNGTTSSYAGINAGLNLGAWRLRHRSSISHDAQGTHSNVLSSYVQREIPRWNSQLLLGQGNTGGELFDSVSFTGVRVATDERMLPDSLRGYAPVVRGIAQSSARVTVRQNGGVLYETTVAPGPFVIDDLFPTSGGGDLQVTITETDGREETFSVAFSAVPQALRAGNRRFSATAGALRDSGVAQDALRFAEATYARGINNRVTLLGGAQLAHDFHAGLLGAAFNTPFGAIGTDVTHARVRLPGGRTQAGNSYRINYQRSITRTGTHLGLAAYRYSTAGYLTLGDVARLAHSDWQLPDDSLMRTRQRFQVNFSQRVGQRSQLYLTGGHVAYWNRAGSHRDLQFGFHSSVRSANYSLSATRYRTLTGAPDTRLSFQLSVPLGRAVSAPRLSSTLNHSDAGQQRQLGINGALGEDRRFTYNLSAEQGHGGPGHTAYASYEGSYADLSASYSRSNGATSANIGAAGSLVLHAGGVNFGPSLGESFAVVAAKGAEGARVGSGRQVTVAGNGYAVLPYTSPYRWNRVELDTAGLPLEVEVDHSSQRVAPTAGSIVKVSFTARRERTLLVDGSDAQGRPLPFGAAVSHDDGRAAGHVGQGGVIVLRAAQPVGRLTVQLGEDTRCGLDYQLPEQPDAHGQYWAQVRCLPLPPRALATDAPLPVPTGSLP
ncbi:fimbria/pilus outer membrane usher protein [Stenotrophomonas sp.]|uniref:fimbria/pilus outer membrane usher protein n=1 Tax=Stenotrophomonas sp. TaxID=69392 RepID=UPI0028A97062|nr:fimbria/pilus outer membrane usher protein [Stenotrophomonas sp.]